MSMLADSGSLRLSGEQLAVGGVDFGSLGSGSFPVSQPQKMAVEEGENLGASALLVDITNNAANFFDDSLDLSSAYSVFRVQKMAAKLLPEHRVKSCFVRMLPGARSVELWRSEGSDKIDPKAKYEGLCSCGSLYACPKCAARIAAVRRDEVELLITFSEVGGYLVALVTLTIPHSRNQSAADVRRLLFDSWRFMVSHRDFRDLDLFGFVRSAEVTHTVTGGWHPHFHCLFIWRKLPTSRLRTLRRSIYGQWARAVVATGGKRPSYAHGVSVRFHRSPLSESVVSGATESPASYLFKQFGSWGLAEEMTKSRLKKGSDKHGSRSPAGLLLAASEGDTYAGSLWVEYVKAFSGSKQLTWSRGLKLAVGVGEVSDDEAAILPDDTLAYSLFDYFIPSVWVRICRAGARGYLLQLAVDSGGDLERFRSVVSRICV